ncbi:hypothetical protein CHUAL_011895 [Chamberlinius hualienensis]
MSMECNFKSEFKLKTVVETLLQGFQDKRQTKVSKSATVLLAKVLQIFAAETAMRALEEAELTKSESVTIEHLEPVIPQLLLDF